MKIKHLFGLAVIAAMTASCSSNEDLGTAGPGTGTNETGIGYATFTINLPTTSGTRVLATLHSRMVMLTSTMYLMLLCWFSRSQLQQLRKANIPS